MCGIIGAVGYDVTNRHIDVIGHRGPDSSGFFKDSSKKSQFTLGHVRLSIQDLSESGSQPFFSGDGKWVMVYNGEIYNHEALRTRYLNGMSFKGNSDTETLLELVAKYGIDIIKECNGIFAFAALNIEQGKLYLCRDPFGVKPLYYSSSGSDLLAFSSEIRGVSEIIGYKRMNLDLIPNLLEQRFLPAPHTIYKDIKKVCPGEIIEFAQGSITKTKFEPQKYSNEIHTSYGGVLKEAIKRQLLSDVEIGIFLSGGIDSAAVSKLATLELNYPLKSYTVGFRNEKVSEIKDASRTANELGLAHVEIHAEPIDYLNLIKKCVKIVEEPIATDSIIPMYYLSERAAQDVKVILTGQGADEPLAGYSRYKLEKLFHNKFFRAATPLHSLIDKFKLTSFSLVDYMKKNSLSERYRMVHQVFSRREIKNLMGISGFKNLEFYNEDKAKIKSGIEKMICLDLNNNLPEDLLMYTDKITMHFGVECRVPMLDHYLVQYIQDLPQDAKLRRFSSKFIHKKFAETILSKSVINRKKKSFESPTAKWFILFRSKIKKEFANGSPLFKRVFNVEEIYRLLEESTPNNESRKKIFLLLSLLYLMDDCDDQP